MSRRRSSLLTIGFQLSAVALTVGCARPSTSQSGGAAPAASASAVAFALRADTPGWKLGERYPYKAFITSLVSMGALGSSFDFDVSADLLVIPNEVTPTSTALLLALRNWKIVSRVPNTQADFDKLAAVGESSGCVIVLNGGRMTALRFERDASPLIANIYREIGSYLQFSSVVATPTEYETEEWDTTGHYRASYHRAATDSGTWQRRKLSYSGVLGSERAVMALPAKVMPSILASSAEVQLLPTGRPNTIHASDEIAFSNAQTPVRSKTTVSLQGGASEVAEPALDSVADATRMVTVLAGQPFGNLAARDALDDARIHGLTYATISERLRAIAAAQRAAHAAGAPMSSAAQLSLDQRQQLFIALAALFRRKPETVTQAAADIRGTSPIADVLLDALGSSGSSKAHEALAQLADDAKLDPKMQERAVSALARTPRPTAAAITALKARLEHDPFRADALYGLGTYARHLRDAGDMTGAAALGDYLVHRLAEAGSAAPRLTVVLGAIMNSGYDGALPAVSPFLSDEREPVRVAAVRSLQSMQGPSINSVLANTIGSDSSGEVRVSALDATAVREPDEALTRAVSNAITTAKDTHVRYRAVALAAQWLTKCQELRAALVAAASGDQEPRVRERAQAALDTPPPGTGNSGQ